MIINTVDYSSSKNLTVSFDNLKITNINFLSKTVSIIKESQFFIGNLSEPKIILSNSPSSVVSIIQ